MPAFSKVVLVHGGELAKDVAEQILAKRPASLTTVETTLRNASERPKTLLDMASDTLVCFIMQTIENDAPNEDGGVTVRFLQRKTHPVGSLLQDKFAFTVLGLGDSNLLFDRQTTGAAECNQVAQKLDARLQELAGRESFFPLGMADERTGLQEVEPWIAGLWDAIAVE